MDHADDYGARIENLFSLAEKEMFLHREDDPGWKVIDHASAELLEGRGCSCSDWSSVHVLEDSDLGAVSNCRFSGGVKMALIPAPSGNGTVEPLLQDCTLENVEIGAGCRIVRCGLLRNIVVHPGTSIENCGRLLFSPGSTCGCGTWMDLGVETGERRVPSFPFLDVPTAALLSSGEGRGEPMALYMSRLERFLEKAAGFEFGSIGPRCSITDTPVIEDCMIGEGVTISCAQGLRNCTVLGGARVRDGALVRSSILKWDSLIDSMAIVEGSVVDEASTVEKHGKVSSSFLGPNSTVAEGEVTATLAGPFTSAHHQSLLIAARWPGGRGNLGYGANIGSNHTSRMPDQEIRPGEGMFFGLACSVKFPADFSEAPYSIVATGVITLPQKVCFPFSLICQPFASHEGIPPAYNQIIPAWMLSDNLFALDRNSRKYRERDRTRHQRSGVAEILRDETVELMLKALKRLEVKRELPVYTGGEIEGLGKNFLTEEHRKKAIETYRFHIRHYALRAVSADDRSDRASELQERILQEEFSGMDADGMLRLRDEMAEVIERSISASRKKDLVRGMSMISDYSDVRVDE